MARVEVKWRPTLAMITAGMIALVIVLALGGFWIVRVNISLPAEREIAVAALVAFAGAGVLGAVFVRTISRPLQELGERARAIGAGDKSAIQPLRHHGTRELALVTERFMSMAQTLSAHSDYLRTFQRHVSHELKTPLAAIRGAAELMIDNEAMTPPERARFLRNIGEDVARMTRLLERLSEMSRAEQADLAGETSLVDLLPALRSRFPVLNIEGSGDEQARLSLSSESALIALSNLLENATSYGATRADIGVVAHGDDLIIAVEDNGRGVSAGNRDRVFDPFFTTRRAEGGTGMGLSIVRSLLSAYGGTIALGESEAGARFELTIPRAAASAQSLRKLS